MACYRDLIEPAKGPSKTRCEYLVLLGGCWCYLLMGRSDYIRDLPGCARNGKLGAGSGLLAAANIREHCTSGITPKADVQGFSLNFLYVLETVVPELTADRLFPTQPGSTASQNR